MAFIEASVIILFLDFALQVLRTLRHPNIIHMEDVFESDCRINMVMELMLGGELFDYVVEKGTLSEQEASVLVRKVSNTCYLSPSSTSFLLPPHFFVLTHRQ